MAIVSKSDLNFQNALSVIPAAQSFILPVPQINDGATFVFQKGEKSSQKMAGKTGVDSSKTGIVFLNSQDKSWQSVQGDGNGVIIIHDVTPTQGKSLYKKLMQLTGNNLENLDKDKIKLFLKYAHALGLKDVIKADKSYIEDKMDMIEVHDTGVEYFGFYKYKDVEPVKAIRFSGAIHFEDATVSKQAYDNGCIVVQNEGEGLSAIKPETFLKSYTKPNGSPVTLFDVPMKLTALQYQGMMAQRDMAM